MKRFISIIFTVIIIATAGISNSENILEIESAQELIDIISYAAITSESPTYKPSELGEFDKHFLKKFIIASSVYSGNNQLLTDTNSQIKLLNEAFAENLDYNETILDSKISGYIGAKLMTAQEYGNGFVKIIAALYSAPARIDKLSIDEITQLKWLDKRIVIGLKKNSDSGYKYSVTDYSLSGELMMEKEIEEYFQNNYFEYVNSNFGFSMQLPSIFESGIKETESGIESKTQNSVMSVKTFDNAEKWTAKSFYESLIASGLKSSALYEDNNIVSKYDIIDNQTIKYEAYLFSETNVYQASFVFEKSDFEEYCLSLEYLKNTFMILNNEIG